MMDENAVKTLVGQETQKIYLEIEKITEILKPLPAFFERLKNYEEIEKIVTCHEFILNGIKGEGGIINELKKELAELKTVIDDLKKKPARQFSMIFKIVSFISLLLGVIATIIAIAT